MLTEEQCDDHITQLHKWISQFGSGKFPDKQSSIIHKYNIAHHPVAWHTRLQVAPIFEALWGTEKLASSMDGMAIGPPPELGTERFRSSNKLDLGLHLDQSSRNVGLHSYQGAVYLEEAQDDDWCFVVLDRSHLHHEEFFKQRTHPLPRSEFIMLKEEDLNWYASKGCTIRYISVPKGGIVLWDSRTVHTGARPLMYRKNPGRWRYVVFACMVPAFWASEEEKSLKKHGFHNLRCSRHTPAQNFSLFPHRPVPRTECCE